MDPSGASGQGRDALPNALDDLKQDSQKRAKERKSALSGPIDVICNAAYDGGLPDAALETLVDILTQSNELDQASIAKLIRHLYPARRVRDEAVVKVIGCLGQGKGKPAPQAQAAMLKWLIMVFDVLENRAIVSKFYGVLFGLLDMLSLRAPLCHLLALITRRKHVRPFRIQALLELSRNVGNEPHLVGLVRTYKDYYPDVIVGDGTVGRAALFSHPMPEWRDRLLAIQEENAGDFGESTQGQGSFKVVRRGAKRTKVLAVPEVHTSRANEDSVTLEEVENVEDFVQKLEKIELPNQVISVLCDPLLQKFLAMRPSDTATARIDNWLSAFLAEELLSAHRSQDDDRSLSQVLSSILTYARYKKNLPPACERFLVSYLPKWDGQSHTELILELATYVPIISFADLQTMYFEPIELAILSEDPVSKITLLDFYTSTLRNWTVRLLTGASLQERSAIGAASASFTRLVQHADTLCLSILESATPTPLTYISSVMTFYEVAAASTTHGQESAIRITTPSAHVIYLLTFTSSLSALSRLCAILATYKRAFEGAMGAVRGSDGEGLYPRDRVNHFNGFLMDICNCVWRNRAFNREDVNALGCLIPESILPSLRAYAEDMGHSLPTMFSLSHSTTLCALSIACFRELEDAAADEIMTRHAGPVTQRGLSKLANEGGLKISWSNYRLEVLQWLEARGVRGVAELMYNTMKHLMLNKAGSGAPVGGAESAVS